VTLAGRTPGEDEGVARTGGVGIAGHGRQEA
jgi:hypothetical protein